jgi:hypothetical protein
MRTLVELEMAANGHELERLVADLESLLLGTGFTVAPNDCVFDGDGNQIAEFDITIEGRVGSTRFRWLVECRDRPSEGAAPASWIQQLAGRREQFDFDKIVAVSTTGFSPAAAGAAKKLNITLRTVTSVAQISEQFGRIDFRLERISVKLRGEAEFGFPPDAVADALSLGGLINDPEIRYKGEDSFVGLRDFIRRDYLNNRDIKDPETDERRALVFKHRTPMELRVRSRIIPVSEISVPVIVEYTFHPTTAITVKSYAQSGEVIGEEVSITSETDDEIVKAAVLVTRKEGEVVVIQRG